MNEKIKRKAHVKQSFSLDFLERGTFTEYPYRTLMDTNKILTDLEQTRNCLSIYQNSELRDIIPLISHTRKFSKRMKKLIILLYKINNIFSKSKAK